MSDVIVRVSKDFALSIAVLPREILKSGPHFFNGETL